MRCLRCSRTVRHHHGHGKGKDNDDVSKTITKLRKARARNLSADDVDSLIKDLNEEFLLAGSYLNLESKYRADDEMK